MKAKRIRKILMCFLLIFTISATTAYTVWQTPKEVKALALIDDAAIILLILASVGCMYYGTLVSQNAPDLDNWTQNLSDRYNEALKKSYDWIISNEGIYEGDYNFDPNNDDPNKKPPKWDDLKEWIKKNGNKLKVTAGGALAAILGAFGKSLYDKAQEGKYLPDDSDFIIPENFSDIIKHHPYYIMGGYDGKQYTSIRYFKYPPALFPHDTLDSVIVYSKHQTLFPDYSYITTSISSNWEISEYREYVNFGESVYITNIPIYPSKTEAIAATSNYENQTKPGYVGTINPDTLPFGTDAQNYIKNNPDSPTVPVAPQTTAPTQEEIQKYLQDLYDNQNSPEPKQTVINNFIQNLTQPKTEPSPLPDPDPEPDPNPKPDPDPQPTVTPKPDEPQNPDIENGKYTYDLKNLFPFCIPWDLMHAVRVLDAEPVAPVFSIPFHIEFRGKVYADENWTLDFQDYETVIQILRVMEVLGFIVALIVATRALIKG